MIKTSWQLNHNFGYSGLNDPQINQDIAQAKAKAKQFITTWQNDPSYLTSISQLRLALDQYQQWLANYGTAKQVDYYLFLKQSLSQSNPRISAKVNKLSFTSKRIENDIQFFLLNLSKLTVSQQKKFLSSPLLADYHNFLKNLFATGKHLLTDAEEKILNLKSQVSSSNWAKMTSRLLSQSEGKVTQKKHSRLLPFSKITALVDNQDYSLASSAGLALNTILSNLSDVAESEINSILEDKYIEDQLRHYPRPDSDRHLADDIDTTIVDALIKAVDQNFQLSHRYYQFKSRILAKKTVPYFWRNVSIGSFDRHFSPTQTIDIVNQVLLSLDPSFSQIFNQLLHQGQIDFFPKKGKVDGAFCTGGLLSSTSYILLNYSHKLRDVTTLAHEVGHAINNELIRTNQNSLNFDTSLAIAEVASTFFEDFVLSYLQPSLNPSQQFSLIMARLDDDINTVFRQIACYNFETELHRQFRKVGYLSKKVIGQLFLKHMQSYLGSAVELSDFQNWWIYWSHIRNPFYVYSYASGQLISSYLQQQTRQNPSFISTVKNILRAGTSQSPQQIFLSAGINLSDPKFWLSSLETIKHRLNTAENTFTPQLLQ